MLACFPLQWAAQSLVSGAPPKGPAAAGLFRAVTFNVKFNNIGQPLFRGLEWTTIAHSVLNLCYVVGLYDETFHVEMKPTFVLT